MHAPAASEHNCALFQVPRHAGRPGCSGIQAASQRLLLRGLSEYLWRLPRKLIPFPCKGDARPILPARLHVDCDDILHNSQFSLPALSVFLRDFCLSGLFTFLQKRATVRVMKGISNTCDFWSMVWGADLFGLKLPSLLIVHAPGDLQALGGPGVELLQCQLQGHLHCAWRPLLAPSKPAVARQLPDTVPGHSIWPYSTTTVPSLEESLITLVPKPRQKCDLMVCIS